MSKKLSTTAVGTAAKKVYVKRQFHLEDNQGEIWDVDIDTQMNPVCVPEMAKDLITFVAKTHDEGIVDEVDIEKNWTVLYFVSLMKYYTSVEIKEKETAVKTLSAYVKLIQDLDALGLLNQIVDCFDQKAMETTTEKFTACVAELSNLVVEETDKLIQEAKGQTSEDVSVEEVE